MRELLNALNAPPLSKVMPIDERLWTWGQKTYIMGIINITPNDPRKITIFNIKTNAMDIEQRVRAFLETLA